MDCLKRGEYSKINRMDLFGLIWTKPFNVSDDEDIG